MHKPKKLDKIISLLEEQPGSRPMYIANRLGVSRQYVQKLLAQNKHLFSVTGVGPNRFYKVKNNDTAQDVLAGHDSVEWSELIEDHYYGLTPLGEELVGNKGFNEWCLARNYSVEQKQKEYLDILMKYYPKSFISPIDMTKKLIGIFDQLYLTKIWAVDYYNFEIFGKTKLGTKVMIAKQTGDADALGYLANKLNTAAEHIIKQYNIDAVAFVSPTIQRQSQLMSKLEEAVGSDVNRVKIHKVGARILVAQKTLKNLQDRIINAKETFITESNASYKNVLIIDDALGSGATLNEIAKQIISKGISDECYGLVLVASPSGYEIINEV